jgi:hypothetical protein
MEHRVHILGFTFPVQITAEQETQIRNIIIGADVTTGFLSLSEEKRTVLVRTSCIVAIESRPSGAKWPYDVTPQRRLFD